MWKDQEVKRSRDEEIKRSRDQTPVVKGGRSHVLSQAVNHCWRFIVWRRMSLLQSVEEGEEIALGRDECGEE